MCSFCYIYYNITSAISLWIFVTDALVLGTILVVVVTRAGTEPFHVDVIRILDPGAFKGLLLTNTVGQVTLVVIWETRIGADPFHREGVVPIP